MNFMSVDAGRLFIFKKMGAQNLVSQLRLIQAQFFRFAAHLFAVVIFNNNRLICFRKCPKTDVAIKSATLTCRTFGIVALLTKRLPIFIIVTAAARSRYSVIWRKLDVWFALSAMRTFVVSCRFDSSPKFRGGLSTRFTFRPNVQGNNLIFGSLFNNARKALFTLKLSHASERINIRLFAFVIPRIIYQLPNFAFAYLWTRNPVSFWPKSMQQQIVDIFIPLAFRNKVFIRFRKPFFADDSAWSRCGLRWQQ